LQIGESLEENIVVKAYRLLKLDFNLPPVSIHLHKQIPTGAGLGGGSSDAAFTLTGLNELFHLNLDKKQLIDYASILGSDCAFFMINYPVFAQGRGNMFSEIEINLKGYSLVLIKPNFSVSTSSAYKSITPKIPEHSLKESIKFPIEFLKDKIENQFVEGVFESHPQLKLLKEKLYQQGAIYASMSGSGSSVYGIYDLVPKHLKNNFPDCFYREEPCCF